MIFAILGLSVAIAAIFCITVAETLVGKPVFENYRPFIAAALATAGVAVGLWGFYLARKRAIAQMAEDGPGSTKRFLLFDLRYWGPMLVVLGAITLFICPLRSTKVQVVQATPPPPVEKEAAVEAPPPKPKAPVEFPALKVQGIIFREMGSYAIVNGRSYSVGDRLGDVVIKSIQREGVALELSGEVKMLTIK